MQANKIRFGKEYAVNYKGNLHAMRVDEMINIKTSDNSATNYIGGVLTTLKTEDGDTIRVKYAVADVLEEIETYRELIEEKARLKLEAEAKVAARIAKKERAATLLARAIGVHVILESRAANYSDLMQQPHVRAVGYSGIDIDEKAFDALIDYLEAQGVTVDELEEV